MSCDYYVTCLFIITKNKKKFKIKRNIKSRKIDKRKRKMLVFKAFHNRGSIQQNYYMGGTTKNLRINIGKS